MRPAFRRQPWRIVWTAIAATALTIGAAAQTASDNAADAARLVEILAVHEGSVVAEIGAGSGELTVAMARTAGPSGHVYSNDLNADRRAEIRDAVDAAGVENITIVEGRSAEANLPEACCDALFMRNVYHHFADPAAMNRSLFRSLKPGGRIAIIDLKPDEDTNDPAARSRGKTHGVTPAHVEQELRAAGFEGISSEKVRGGLFLVVGRRPS